MVSSCEEGRQSKGGWKQSDEKRLLTLPTSALLRTLSATASGCCVGGDDAMAVDMAIDAADSVVEVDSFGQLTSRGGWEEWKSFGLD